MNSRVVVGVYRGLFGKYTMTQNARKSEIARQRRSKFGMEFSTQLSNPLEVDLPQLIIKFGSRKPKAYPKFPPA